MSRRERKPRTAAGRATARQAVDQKRQGWGLGLTLLRDVIVGDQTLFMRRDTVEASWRFVQHILDYWATSASEPIPYAAGSWGPTEAAVMIAKDGRAWRNL